MLFCLFTVLRASSMSRTWQHKATGQVQLCMRVHASVDLLCEHIMKIRIQSMTDWFKLPLCTVCFLQRNLGYLSSWVRSLFADGFVTWSGRWGSLRAYFKEIRFRCFCKIGEDKLKTVIVVEKEKWTGVYNLCEQVCPNQRHARKATVSTAPGCWAERKE